MEDPYYQYFILHGTAVSCNWWEARDHTGGPFNRAWTDRLAVVPVLGQWHRIEIATLGNQISVTIDGDLLLERVDNLHPSGGVEIFAYHAITEFDNVVIEGEEIPDVGPSGPESQSIEPATKLPLTWASLRRQ